MTVGELIDTLKSTDLTRQVLGLDKTSGLLFQIGGVSVVDNDVNGAGNMLDQYRRMLYGIEADLAYYEVMPQGTDYGERSRLTELKESVEKVIENLQGEWKGAIVI